MLFVGDSAKTKIEELIQSDNLTPQHFVRVSVTSGGCSGLTYNMEFDNQESWIFINSAYQFQNPYNPFSEVYSGDATKVFFSPLDGAPLNWVGLKVGDVNDSADGGQ